MKLNYKRVLLVGMAFFLICTFWQAYDAIIPITLTNKFGMKQSVSGVVMALDNILALFLLPFFGNLSDKCKSKHGKRTPFIFIGTLLAVTFFILLTFVDNAQLKNMEAGASNVFMLALFLGVLLCILLSMSIFRSPAVALMPDVVVKPLRSKANAIINLMGTFGGISVLILGIVFGTGKEGNELMSYTYYVMAVCGVMLAAFVIFMLTVKEPKWNAEMLKEQENIELELDPEERSGNKKLSKGEFKSLVLILASVALWYFGYNAVTSKFSVYASTMLGKDFNFTLIIAQIAAIISYIPAGLIASKIGRKKSILLGVATLFIAFFGAIFITKESPDVLMNILFVLAGIGWATINVNSFPMVVELAVGSNIGKYTGYYYTASMAAQIFTPMLSGLLMDAIGMEIYFPYAAIFVALSFVTMLFVKHGDIKVAEKA